MPAIPESEGPEARKRFNIEDAVTDAESTNADADRNDETISILTRTS